MKIECIHIGKELEKCIHQNKTKQKSGTQIIIMHNSFNRNTYAIKEEKEEEEEEEEETHRQTVTTG